MRGAENILADAELQKRRRNADKRTKIFRRKAHVLRFCFAFRIVKKFPHHNVLQNFHGYFPSKGIIPKGCLVFCSAANAFRMRVLYHICIGRAMFNWESAINNEQLPLDFWH